jgi:glutathione S-transferase
VIRNLFGGKPPPDKIAAEVRAAVEAGARALRKLARFDGFLVGDRFTAADIAGVIHFPAVRRLTQAVLGCDPLADVPGLVAYSERMEQRPTVQQVLKDRDADLPHFFAHIRKLFGG